MTSIGLSRDSGYAFHETDISIDLRRGRSKYKDQYAIGYRRKIINIKYFYWLLIFRLGQIRFSYLWFVAKKSVYMPNHVLVSKSNKRKLLALYL